MVYEYVGTVLVRFGTAIVDVCLVVVDDIVVVVVNCVGIDRCTEKCFQRFQRLNFMQAVSTAVSAELWFKIVIFQTCLIWPSINDNVTIHHRRHNQTKINMENILV